MLRGINFFLLSKRSYNYFGAKQILYMTELQKKPELTASNIAPGDDVTLTVNEEANLVGTYTATAVLSGKDANRYILPTECKKEFSILPSQTIFDGGVKSYHEKMKQLILTMEI
mgnify:CR=1 FL=1